MDDPTEIIGDEWAKCQRLPGYEINRSGVVRDKRTGSIMREQYASGHPYVAVTRRYGGQASARINVLLHEAFGPGTAEALGLSTPRLVKKYKPTRSVESKGKRRCHDCNAPTHNYRCKACWENIRGCSDVNDYGMEGV